METIQNLSEFIIYAVRICATLSIVINIFFIYNADNDRTRYIRRIKHIIIFVIFTEAIWIIKSIVLFYFPE